mmetsp:Transcript_80086/g.151266  ORF Transcript_80086/g.151266 Transcript_80086/m.151266 type:complete len:209 (+) Transcript_80086:1286-1912(+)
MRPKSVGAASDAKPSSHPHQDSFSPQFCSRRMHGCFVCTHQSKRMSDEKESGTPYQQIISKVGGSKEVPCHHSKKRPSPPSIGCRQHEQGAPEKTDRPVRSMDPRPCFLGESRSDAVRSVRVSKASSPRLAQAEAYTPQPEHVQWQRQGHSCWGDTSAVSRALETNARTVPENYPQSRKRVKPIAQGRVAHRILTGYVPAISTQECID